MALLRLPEHYYAKNVMKCSGGERQRVATGACTGL